MSFELGKFLQTVDLKLRGRIALLAFGEGVMGFAFWLVMKDYSIHPVFSAVTGGGLVLGILVSPLLALLGKERPDEVHDKSLMHVGHMGIFLAQGPVSQKDMIKVMREISGLRPLPEPSYAVKGSASDPSSYVPLSSDQARAVVSQIERGVESLLSGFINKTAGQVGTSQLEESHSEKPQQEVAKIKGKALML